MYWQIGMNIDEDFVVAAARLCDVNTVPRRMQVFLSVLTINIQKQTEILRDKPREGSLVIQLCQKLPEIASSFEHVRNSCDIAAIVALKSR